MIKLLPYLVMTMLALSCATSDRKTSIELRNMVLAQKFDAAIALLNQSPLVKNEKSQLLYYYELGLLNHYKGDYVQSNIAFNQSKELIDELYTTRVSGKFASFLNNDNSDFYYGEKYEASLVYFYLSLNYFMQANSTIDLSAKKVFLRQARAEIAGWDSFLTEIKAERLGKAYFKEDLLAKTFGGLIHEAQETREDNQIALQLYKDANDVLLKNYNLFPTFNESYQSFKDNFESLHTMPVQEVERNYVLETNHNKSLRQFLLHKITGLSAKENKSQKSLSQINFLLQDGLIIEKQAQKHDFPIFLGPQVASGLTFGMGNTISFELPFVGAPPILEDGRIEALDASGAVVTTSPLSIVAPLAELAQQAINEHSKSIAAKTGARVVAKHIAALVSVQVAYNSSREQHPAIALMVATVGHSVAVAAINESEKADVRYWSTLPSNIRLGQLSLPNGTYSFRAVYGTLGTPNYRTVDLGVQEITKGARSFVMNNKTLIQPTSTLAGTEQSGIGRGLSSKP